MEYKQQRQQQAAKFEPRLIIHGGAGNITPANLPPERWSEYHDALAGIISKATTYMTTSPVSSVVDPTSTAPPRLPTALETATFAVKLLEDSPLFNSGRGAVFTRDGINELEASVMVSRGYKKRAACVSGIRRVRNPILLARAMLEHGEDDLEPMDNRGSKIMGAYSEKGNRSTTDATDSRSRTSSVPSAQGHEHLHGDSLTAALASLYDLEVVDPGYFFTQKRWDEHVRGLEREKEKSLGRHAATWSRDEYLPQGTVGAVALDSEGVVCVATSTGGLTNKLTGRIGDTPTIGAGVWAGEWVDSDAVPGFEGMDSVMKYLPGGTPKWLRQHNDGKGSLWQSCFPSSTAISSSARHPRPPKTHKTRAFAGSGTGNGDSFLRLGALHAVASRAQWKPESSADALSAVAGPGGDLERSAGDRWGRTGEGQGGIIGIECSVVRDLDGEVIRTESSIVQDFNCGGMFRAWVDDAGISQVRVWRDE